MCNKLIKLLLESGGHNTGEGWMGRLRVFGLEEDFRQSSTYKTMMEAGKKRRIERENDKLDGKLLKGKRNENSGKGHEIRMEKCENRGGANGGSGNGGGNGSIM